MDEATAIGSPLPTPRKSRPGLVVLTAAALFSAPTLGFGFEDEEDRLAFPAMSLDQDPKPPPPAAKPEPKLPWRTFEFMFGGTYSSVTTSIILNRTNHAASLAVDAEGVLGLSREVLSPYVWAAYRLGERHRIEFSFDDLTRTATRDIRRDITVGDVTYPVGTPIHSELGLQFFSLGWVWSFLQDERMEVGLMVNIDVVRTHVEINIESPPVVNNERWTVPIPLPGLTADFVLVKDLWLRERLDLLYLSIQNYSGLMVDLNLALEWSFLENLSIGFGGDLMRTEFESTSNSSRLGNFDGKFKLNAAGFLFYLGVHF
jgi:hypothetical protein